MNSNFRGFIRSVLVLALTAPIALNGVVIDDAITPSGLGIGGASVADGNISIDFSVSSNQSGLNSVVVEGIEQLSTIEWFYRVGSTGPEFPLSAFSGLNPLDNVTVMNNMIVITGNTSFFG